MSSSARCGPGSLILGLIGVATLSVAAGILPAILVADLLYAFNLFMLGPILVLFFANLMIMGWAVALGVVSLILRHGAGAEALAWSLLFGLTPLSAVFYPVSALPPGCSRSRSRIPPPMSSRACAPPCSTGRIPPGARCSGRSASTPSGLLAAGLLFASQFRAARVRGALITIGEYRRVSPGEPHVDRSRPPASGSSATPSSIPRRASSSTAPRMSASARTPWRRRPRPMPRSGGGCRDPARLAGDAPQPHAAHRPGDLRGRLSGRRR